MPPARITNGKIAIFFYGEDAVNHADEEADFRAEIDYYYLESSKLQWYETFLRLARKEPHMYLDEFGVTVEDFVQMREAAEKKRMENMSVDEWWNFEFEPHAQAIDSSDQRGIRDMQQPPRPEPWLEPWEAVLRPRCGMCGESRLYVGKHHTSEDDDGWLLCQNCVDNHFGGHW